MKIITKILFCLTAFSAFTYAKTPIKTLESVNVPQFLGTWYRISSNPVAFEPKCLCARQVLGDSGDGRVSVYNSCNRANSSKELVEIRGFATAIDSSASKLAVDFGLPWKGSYWIVAFDAVEGYAIVTDKWGYSLYIMSRTPDMTPELHERLVKIAETAGVKVNRLKIQSNEGCVYPN